MVYNMTVAFEYRNHKQFENEQNIECIYL